MQRRVERALPRLLAVERREAHADLLERERIVADEVTVALDERKRRLRRLAVALDRGSLSAADVALVTDRYMHDVRPVLGLAADHERRRELEPDDLGTHLHRARAYSESEAT